MTVKGDDGRFEEGERLVVLSQAQADLIAQKVTVSQLASACFVSKVAAHKWLAGASKPGAKQRDSIEKKFGVEGDLWDVAPSAPEDDEDADEDEPEEDDESDGDAKSEARAHLGLVKTLLRAAQKANRPADILKLLELHRKAILDLAKFNGELTATDESRLTETGRWLAVRKTLIEALVRYPQAAKDVAKALEELEA